MLILPFGGLMLTFFTLILIFYGHGEHDFGEISSPHVHLMCFQVSLKKDADTVRK